MNEAKLEEPSNFSGVLYVKYQLHPSWNIAFTFSSSLMKYRCQVGYQSKNSSIQHLEISTTTGELPATSKIESIRW